MGLVIEATAFLISQSDAIPVFYRILSPTYYYANNGISLLFEKQKLEPQDQGFDEISQMFKNIAATQNSAEILEQIKVTEFILKGGMLAFSETRAREVINVEVKLSNGQSLLWDMEEIRKLIDATKVTNIFHWTSVLFLIGIVIQIMGFLFK